MKKLSLKSMVPHFIAVLVFIVISFAYFSPLLEGKRILQSDIVQFIGMSKEVVDFREETGEEALWTNRMFGGMPAYLISVVYPGNLFRFVNRVVSLRFPVPARFLFLSLISFYILLLAFRVDPWLSIAGALAFGFSTYFFIIGGVGHNSKAHAMAYMPGIVAGIVLAFRGKRWWGAAVAGVFLALQLYAGHLQITYYTAMVVLLMGLAYLVVAVREQTFTRFLKTAGALLFAALLAAGANITSVLVTAEYGKYSTRGESELTLDAENKTRGLDKDYILNDYSYGIKESMNLLIPNFLGGKSVGELDESSSTYKVLRRQNPQAARQFIRNMPLYWGEQRYTAGPVYLGAVVVFLFVLGMFLVKGPVRWWVAAAALLSLMLAWGKHFYFLSDLFIDYFPGYSKFRTVSMILVVMELVVPLLGFLAVKQIVEGKTGKDDFWKAMKWSAGIVGGITLFFALFPGWLLNFQGPVDQQLQSAGWPDALIEALRDDRKILLRKDALRSFIFVVFTFSLLLAYHYKKISPAFFYVTLAGLVLIDLWPVNKRYLNNDFFTSAREVREPFRPTRADQQILQDTTLNFRVMNLTVSTFNDASTSYFHNSIGGYHGAKMKRYQELIDRHISRNNTQVLNMLNTRYYIVPDENNQPQARFNPGALGNVWFVDSLRWVENADEEIEALSDFDPATEAIIDQRFSELLAGYSPGRDTASFIRLESYRPNKLEYVYRSSKEQVAVFSEIYYEKGWISAVDGEHTPHFRVNYVLRGMLLPAGEHRLTFEFKPRSYFVGEKISLASSVLLLLFFLGMAVKELRTYTTHNLTQST
ncbi:MAG: YfhO family protein [Bacteroidales bacterium]